MNALICHWLLQRRLDIIYQPLSQTISQPLNPRHSSLSIKIFVVEFHNFSHSPNASKIIFRAILIQSLARSCRFTMWFELLSIVIGICSAVYFYLVWNFEYWRTRGVLAPKPKVFFGNFGDSGKRKCHATDEFTRMYK